MLHELLNETINEQGVPTVKYRMLDGWEVTLEFSAETQEFVGLHIRLLESAPGVEPGISNRKLRMIPFRDARQRALRLLRVELMASQPPPPKSLKTPADFAALAKVFLAFDAAFPDEPLKQMAEHFELNRNTLAARVNQTKDMGYIRREGKHLPYILTERAVGALEGDPEQ